MLIILGCIIVIAVVEGALTNTHVQHDSYNAGVLGESSIQFQADSSVPVNGRIDIIYPAGVAVATDTISVHSGIDVGCTVSFNAGTRTVSVAIVNTIVASASVISFKVNKITNRAGGTGGTYTIATYDNSAVLLDQDAAVAANVFITTVMSAATVVPDSTNAGVRGNVVITFTTVVDVPSGGQVDVEFPSGFQVASTTGSSFSGGIDGGSTVGFSGQIVTLTLGAALTAGAGHSFTVNLITNPAESTTGLFAVSTEDGSNQVYENIATVVAQTITHTTMSAATIVGTSLEAGVQTTYTTTFTSAVDYPVGSKIVIVFPTLPNSVYTVATDTISGHVDIDATSTSIERPNSLTLRLIVAGTPVTAGSGRAFVINLVSNPAAQSTGVFQIMVTDSANQLYEQKTDVAQLVIVKTTLSALTTVTPCNYTAGATAKYQVSLQTAVDYPLTTLIRLTFPNRFGVATTTIADHSNINTASTGAFAGQVVTLTVAGAVITAGAARVYTVDAITNPGSSCNEYLVGNCNTKWEDYTISVEDTGGNIYEDSSAITGSPIIKTNATFARVRTESTTPGTVTTATITFDTLVAVPIGGTIVVTFPTSMTVGTAAISGFVNIDATSTRAVSGQAVTVTIAGTALAAGLGHQFVLSDITTPGVDDTGYYQLKTTDDGGNVFQDKINIQGEGCLNLNRCNYHGECTLISSKCLCEVGWGTSTETSYYKTPDCSTRVCPSGPSWTAVASSTTIGHAEEECSGGGLCDRSTGTCSCFAGYSGNACQRYACPNDCSGHGTCLSMKSLAGTVSALPLSAATTYKDLETTTTWDEDRLYACVCDSSWARGLASGEYQEGEYFGYDCSKRRCPSGSNPATTTDETDCFNVAAEGGFGVGAAGNLCLVECSDQGVCDYNTGVCNCVTGFTGAACSNRNVLK